MNAHRNSFQQWASAYATPRGFAVTMRGNWVELAKAGETITCMSVDGVKRAVASR